MDIKTSRKLLKYKSSLGTYIRMPDLFQVIPKSNQCSNINTFKSCSNINDSQTVEKTDKNYQPGLRGKRKRYFSSSN